MTTEKVNEEIINEETAKQYTLRRLYDGDLWPILDIIAKVLPEDLTAVFMQLATKEKTVEEVGAVVVMRLVTAVLKNMKLVKDDVYTFLSDVSGIPANEIPEMPFGTTPKMIWDIVNNEKNADFFRELSKLS